MGVGHGGDSGGGRQGKVAKEHIAKEKRKALDVKSAGTQHRHPRGKSPPQFVTPARPLSHDVDLRDGAQDIEPKTTAATTTKSTHLSFYRTWIAELHSVAQCAVRSVANLLGKRKSAIPVYFFPTDSFTLFPPTHSSLHTFPRRHTAPYLFSRR
jgi:hypothetical protein